MNIDNLFKKERFLDADDGLTPALRRRRERAERQRNFLNDQENRRGSQSSDNNRSVAMVTATIQKSM